MTHQEKLPDQYLRKSEEAYKQLIESEKKYRTLFESIDEGFCIIEVLFNENGKAVDYRFLEVNPAFEEQTGIKNAEGKKISEIAPNHEEHWFEIYGKVALARESVRFERPAQELDRYFNVFAFPFGDPESKKVAVLFTDITQRKQIEKALQNSKERYQRLFESIDEGFFIAEILVDENGQPNDFIFLETNPSFETQSGMEDPEGKRISQIVSELEGEWFEIFGNVAMNREPIRFEQTSKNLDRVFDIFAFPFGQPEEQKIAVLFSDITERKQTERELRESKERLSTALEIGTVGVIFWGSDFTITEANDAFLNMSGFSYEEAIGKTWQELTPKEFHEASEKAISEVKETGHTDAYEKQYYRKDGSRWWGVFAPRQINDEEVVEYVLDITDRKLREQRDKYLLKLNDTLRSIYDVNQIKNEAIYLLKEQLQADRVLYIESDPEGEQFIIQNDANGKAPSIVGEINLYDYGLSMMEKLRMGNTYIQKDIPNDPDLTEEEKENYQKIDIKSKIAVPLLKKEELVVILAAHQAEPYNWSDHEIALVEETAERTWAYIERLRAEQRLIDLKNNLEDRVKKRTEALRSYQEQLRSLASRLNKAEQNEQHRLAAELHNNLGQLLSLSKMKVQNLEKSSLPEKTIDEITGLSELIDEALNYTRELMSDLKPPPALDKEDFTEVLTWVVRKMEKHGLEVKIEDDNEPKPLNEEVQTTLQQSIKELLFNTVKYADVNEARVIVSRKEDMIQVVVEDHGKGFSMEGNKPVPTEDGGFGLFNIRERMNYLNGKLEIFSEPGKGTKAVLLAPLKEKDHSEQQVEKNKQASQPPDQLGTIANYNRKIKILIVDDHKMVRRGLRNLIEDQNDMSIIAEAADGKKAVELAHKTNPDIVLMDVNMPVMDGIEATRKITTSLPKVKVIGLSLHNQQEVINNMRSAGAIAYLTKDEAFEALCATIRSEVVSLKI